MAFPFEKVCFAWAGAIYCAPTSLLNISCFCVKLVTLQCIAPRLRGRPGRGLGFLEVFFDGEFFGEVVIVDFVVDGGGFDVFDIGIFFGG